MARLGRAQPFPFRRAFRLGSASIVVDGTIFGSSESDIVAGGKTILLTVTGDTWVAAGGTFDAERQNIINGLTSAGAELLGWNNVVKALQGVAGVVRTSDALVTITLDAEVTYNITANETVQVTVPGTALLLGNALVGSPSFTITVAGATADVSARWMQLGTGPALYRAGQAA